MTEKHSTDKLILLAEDDTSMRRYLEVLLKRENYVVLTASDGLEAMQLALDNNLSAVIADVMMPNLSGHDLFRMIRRMPHLNRVPFILLSGFKLEKSEAEDEPDVYLLKDDELKNNLIRELYALTDSDD